MQAQQQDKQKTDSKKLQLQRVNAIIGKQVVTTLGQPGELHRVQVRQLWDDHYRVNVFVGADAASLKIAQSYFLVVDTEGNILASTPKIKRQP